MIGRTISHYQITQRLGSGGMGDIYKAQDTRLNRAVVIKVLSAATEGGSDRRRRFLQEAQAASALNHPNIITIHDIICEDETDFLVMEFVAGKTLAELIPASGLPVSQVLNYALQMASALEAAHDAGIIHRDLKPGNVMITDAASPHPGLVKILDFGLAKFTGPAAQTAGSGPDDTRTLGDIPLTIEGAIMGTLSYMSPEQAEGKPVDARTDIFSFGAILHEMVTGQRAFRGDSPVSTLTSVLRDEARPLGQMAAGVPPELDSLVARCLRKNREQRWQSMRDIRAALELLKRDSDTGTLVVSTPIVPPAAKSRWPLVAAAAVGAIALAGAGGWWMLGRSKANAPSTSATAPPAAGSAATKSADGALTNDDILKMVSADVDRKVILEHIRSSPTRFDLSTAEIIRLSEADVPAEVIEAMRNPKAPPPAAAAAAPPPAPAAPRAPAKTGALPATGPVTLPGAGNPAIAIRPNVQAVSVPDGMPVSVRLTEDVPADAPAGRLLRFVVAHDFRIADNIILAEGAAAFGEVVTPARKKMANGMHVAFRMRDADTTGGGKLALRATPLQRGEDSRRPLEIPTAKHPKNLAASAGALYVAYVQGDQTVTVKK